MRSAWYEKPSASVLQGRVRAGSIEYGLIATLIALAAVTIMGTIGNSIASLFFQREQQSLVPDLVKFRAWGAMGGSSTDHHAWNINVVSTTALPLQSLRLVRHKYGYKTANNSKRTWNGLDKFDSSHPPLTF
jgi:hypothetical protein